MEGFTHVLVANSRMDRELRDGESLAEMEKRVRMGLGMGAHSMAVVQGWFRLR